MHSFVEFDELTQQTTQIDMIINGKKTREMLIGTASKVCMPPVILNDLPIERVDTFKLLGVYLSNDLKWEKHVNAVTSKVS